MTHWQPTTHQPPQRRRTHTLSCCRAPVAQLYTKPIRSTDHRRHSAHINTVALHCDLPAVYSGLQRVPLRLHKNSYQNRSFLSQIKKQPVAREHFTGSYITPLAAAQLHLWKRQPLCQHKNRRKWCMCVRVLEKKKKRGCFFLL